MEETSPSEVFMGLGDVNMDPFSDPMQNSLNYINDNSTISNNMDTLIYDCSNEKKVNHLYGLYKY